MRGELQLPSLCLLHCNSTPVPLLPCPMLQGAVAADPLYSAYHFSHPPLVERLAALDAASKKFKKAE